MKLGKNKLVWIFVILAFVIILCISVFSLITSYRINQIPLMTFDEMISYTTKDNEHAIITVGTIEGGKTTYTVYQANEFYGINNDKVKKKLAKVKLDNKDYKFKYSDFGMAVVGKVLSDVYEAEYTQLLNNFIAKDLKLEQTKISNGTGNLRGYWNWKSDDAYLPAGALVSTISDMMQYIELQMSDDIPYLSQGHEVLADANATTRQYEKMNIRIDGVGVGWMIDSKNNIIWHNGGTSDFNSYIAFDKNKQVGVVILSNCPPNYRIPATVMGAKLMMALQTEDYSQKQNGIQYPSYK